MSKRKDWRKSRSKKPSRPPAKMSVMDLGQPLMGGTRLPLNDEHRPRPLPGRTIGGNPNGPMSWHPSAQGALDRVEAIFNSSHEDVEKAFLTLAYYIEQGTNKRCDSLDIIIPYERNPATNLKVTWKRS